MELRLRYIILFVTCLCVVFIAVEELLQSQFSTGFWKNDKTRFTSSKPVAGLVNDDNKPAHRPVVGIDKNGYNDDDDAVRFSGDVSYRSQAQEWERASDEDDKSDGQKEERDGRWKAWIAKVRGTTAGGAAKTSRTEGNQASLTDRIKQNWKVKDNTDDLSEEEKLRQSPYVYHHDEELEKLKSRREEKEVKYFAYFSPDGVGEDQHSSLNACNYKKCAIVSNLSEADMVVFIASTIRDYDIFTFQRPPGQRWLMHTIDPSVKKGYNFDGDAVKSSFNATMTYNLDADIPFLFGRLRKVKSRSPSYFDPIFDKKSKTAAWFVSHCVTSSRREVYVHGMQSVIDVDIYGECGNFTCGGGPKARLKDEDVCLPMLTKDYKFYLAFENAFCLDYITEKFFKLFKEVQIIPVVRGGFQYKKYLPSGTYINADDFETPEELAQYLKDLGNDKQRYTEMLSIKDEWRLMERPQRNCLLCEYLHSDPPNKFYPNLRDKFGRSSCWFSKLKKLV